MNTHYDRDTLIDYLHGALAPEADAAVFATCTRVRPATPCTTKRPRSVKRCASRRARRNSSSRR